MIKAIVNGKILLPNSTVLNKALLYNNKIIGLVDEPAAREMAAEVIDAGGLYISPGLVDVHIHGYLGADTSDGNAEGMRTVARGIMQNGVTSFLPTTMTIPWDDLEAVFGQLRQLKKESLADAFDGAEILGCHAEGPFINPAKKGAQAEESILAPDAEKLLPYADIINIVSFAPEMPGGAEFIKTIKCSCGMILSTGHTSANYGQTMDAIALGVTHATHTFNAMMPLMHRDPGTVGAVLASDAVYCELIADTFHVNKGLYPLMTRMKADKLVLITDCTRAGGLADGEYTLGGQPIYVKGIECRLADGTIAGSVLKLNDAVRNLRDYASIPLHEAVRCASLNAAASIGLDGKKGSLEAGKDADIVLMDEECVIYQTIIRGNTRYTRSN